MSVVATEQGNDTRTPAGATDAVVYEIGFHVLPTIAEGDVEGVIARLRALIEKEGGAFIAEGAPQRVSLAYPMAVWNNGSWTKYDEAYFGWLKFELDASHIAALEEACKADKSILRHLLIKTVREDTRANVRQFVLKEVKCTDTIKSASRAKPAPETKEEVSDEKLDEAIEELVAD
ncbi:MAG: 30S ribosomal protein S6 [Parcubacteria group bacterium]|nr:30S ribosomal protein S6 [Parcubacteria group bacterium]